MQLSEPYVRIGWKSDYPDIYQLLDFGIDLEIPSWYLQDEDSTL